MTVGVRVGSGSGRDRARNDRASLARSVMELTIEFHLGCGWRPLDSVESRRPFASWRLPLIIVADALNAVPYCLSSDDRAASRNHLAMSIRDGFALSTSSLGVVDTRRRLAILISVGLPHETAGQSGREVPKTEARPLGQRLPTTLTGTSTPRADCRKLAIVGNAGARSARPKWSATSNSCFSGAVKPFGFARSETGRTWWAPTVTCNDRCR